MLKLRKLFNIFRKKKTKTDDLIEKLDELGYKGYYEIIGPNKKKVDKVIIGEVHNQKELVKDQIEIIKTFNPEVVFHEGYCEGYVKKPNMKKFIINLDLKHEKSLEMLQNEIGFTIKGLDDEILKNYHIKVIEKMYKEYQKIVQFNIASYRTLTFLQKIYPEDDLCQLDQNTINEKLKSGNLNSLEKENIRRYMLKQLVDKTVDYLIIKNEEFRELTRKKYEILNRENKIITHWRSLTMFEKIKNEDKKCIAIVGQTHAVDMAEMLKYPNPPQKETYLILRQADAKFDKEELLFEGLEYVEKILKK